MTLIPMPRRYPKTGHRPALLWSRTNYEKIILIL